MHQQLWGCKVGRENISEGTRTKKVEYHWSKVRVCGHLLLGLRVRIPAGGMNVSLMSVVCCRVEVCAKGRSLVQRTATGCGVFK